jgi:hypothetical protein
VNLNRLESAQALLYLVVSNGSGHRSPLNQELKTASECRGGKLFALACRYQHTLASHFVQAEPMTRDTQATYQPNGCAPLDQGPVDANGKSLSDLTIRNPAPDASPPSVPSGTYRDVRITWRHSSGTT